MICAMCGKEFEKVGRQIYCSKECRHEANKLGKNRRRREKRIEESRKASAANNKLEQILAECKEQGIDYSEWKKRKAIELAGRVQI